MYRKDQLGRVSEEDHDAVYGATFARYTQEDLEAFLQPFEMRIKANGLDADELFAGKCVLDAGCGGGRGSLLALRHGARRVVALDVSQRNIDNAGRMIREYGYENAEVVLGTLEQIFFADGEFDFVWCNGVLMHTARPAGTLTELIRVMRPGGLAWIYVYGAGGMYWRFMSTFRRTFADAQAQDVIRVLNDMGLPAGRVAELLDDWKTPFLRTFRSELVESALDELGCEAQRLLRGMPYDTSEQLARGANRDLIGDGDLRYLVSRGDSRHQALSPSSAAELNNSHLVQLQSAAITSAPDAEAQLEMILSNFEASYSDDPLQGVKRAAESQLLLRDAFLPEPSIDVAMRCAEPLSS